MGIGYMDSVIVYNRVAEGPREVETYYGTRFDDVRVELTQGNQITMTGNQNADACRCKIPKGKGRYLPPRQWDALEDKTSAFTLDQEHKTFFVIVKKDSLGIDIDLPTGKVDSNLYGGNFFQYVEKTYGYAYQLSTVDVYDLVPRVEIGGK